jgi:hypothetical protein
MEYPKYACHKEVSAAKIAGVEHGADGSLTLHLEGGFDNVVFSHEEMKRKHKPEAGWYLIVYADGFKSFSPATAFEQGYTLSSDPMSGAASDNVIAFDSAVKWREYAAALERKLNLDTHAIADDVIRTTAPSMEEIAAVPGLPGLSGANAAAAGTTQHEARVKDLGPVSVDDDEDEDEDEEAANAQQETVGTTG